MFDKLKRLLEPGMANKKDLFQNIIHRAVVSSYGIVNIFFIQIIVSIVQSEDLSGAWNIAIYFAIFNIAYLVFAYLTRNWRWINLDNAIQKYVQRKYMKMFNDFDNTIVEAFGTGKLSSILNKGVGTWATFIFEGTYAITSFLISLLALLVMVWKIGSGYNIFVILIVLVLINIGVIALVKKTVPYRKEVVEKRVVYDAQFVKMVMSKFEILQNGRINKEIGILDRYYQEMTDNRKKMWSYAMFINIIPDTFVFLIYFVFLILLIYSKVPFSLVLSFFMIITYFNGMLRELLWFYDFYTREFYNIEKLWNFTDNTPQIKGLKNGKEFEFINGDIELNKINFGYSDKIVFKDFSLKVKGKKITALVGESGGGKTTLMKLLSGFIEPSAGDILIDGQNLKDINLLSYYKNIGYLTQDPSVFDGSVLENLTYGAKEEVTEKRLQEIIKLSRCDFIYDLPKGLKTQIGERGVRLSGGQKQRLAIAKIFIKDPDIIFLDEPTSALDSKSEKLIQESFANLFKGRTVVIIAHRLQTVKNADEIFVIEKGKVIENGTHNSLVRKGGHYKEMLDLQSGF